MFDNLTERLNDVFKQLRRHGKLSEKDVETAMRDVRMALLDADVNYGVVKDFVARVQARAIGAEVSKALNPAQQVIKIVNDELIATLGTGTPLNLSGARPRILMLVGLQGSGKTTAAGKLARLLRSKGERVMLVAADPYRPAAVTQLQTLGTQLDIPVFSEAGVKPPALAAAAAEKGEKGGYSVLILDTAGRSQLDQELMGELQAIRSRVHPVETILVVDAMTGQEAVNIAKGFRDAVPLTGLILTKMDGDARGGAAISIRSVTGVPIKFIGTGEGLDAIEAYDASRLASRILGMGDVIGLIERAESTLDQETARRQAEKMIKGEFTLQDFADQIRQVRKMGPIGKILDMLPGDMGQLSKAVDPHDAERQMKVTEAILSSMTRKERLSPDILNASRRRRIASGSGTQVQDVNRLIKQFLEARRMLKTIKKTGMRGVPRLFG
jgi:signal recognition particle subunit SRP54